MILAGVYAGVAEGLVYGQQAGLPMETLLEALAAGAADSWALRNRGESMVINRYPLGFRSSLHLKDVRIGLREGAALGLSLPVASLVADLEGRLPAAGFGDEDVSNLARSARGEVSGASSDDLPVEGDG